EALRMLNGTQLGGQNIRLSWGRSPSNKQVIIPSFNHLLSGNIYIFVAHEADKHTDPSVGFIQPQVDPNQWNGGYYGYAPGFETYGYVPPTAQDPNLYNGGYPGYGNYPPTQQQQPQVGCEYALLL
ncbi:unnamed protein product, partial [Ilex paraguariensis]